MDFLKYKISPLSSGRLLLCDAIPTSKVKRSWRSKWRVSPNEYPDKEYPTYCAGWAILYSLDTVFLLYQEAQKQPFFWIDDVHITGTLAKKIHLVPTSIHSMILPRHVVKILLNTTTIKGDFLFGPPDLLEYKIRALYTAITTNV